MRRLWLPIVFASHQLLLSNWAAWWTPASCGETNWAIRDKRDSTQTSKAPVLKEGQIVSFKDTRSTRKKAEMLSEWSPHSGTYWAEDAKSFPSSPLLKSSFESRHLSSWATCCYLLLSRSILNSLKHKAKEIAEVRSSSSFCLIK